MIIAQRLESQQYLIFGFTSFIHKVVCTCAFIYICNLLLAADFKILHPPEDGVHRQALLLRRGNHREVRANKSETLRDEATRGLVGETGWGVQVNRWLARTECEG